ncbi:MAG: hypothetical protein NTV92_00930, partial [Candidatus Bipolaricaulota bacterium]|nr:hypothetical protein [Candidatus Bipolaricaulota bacterium]
EGILRRAYFDRGTYTDLAMHSILRGEAKPLEESLASLTSIGLGPSGRRAGPRYSVDGRSTFTGSSRSHRRKTCLTAPLADGSAISPGAKPIFW